MLTRFRAGSALFAVPLLFVLMAGCAGRVEYRSYGPAEEPYYNQWVVETHHDHVDYEHLSKRDQKNYWRWRHDHPDRH